MSDPQPMRMLYLCYIGLQEPLVQTQVLPYLRQLVAGGIEVHLLTFEPEHRRLWSRAAVNEWRGRLQEERISWSFLPYHKRPSLPATLYDIGMGAWSATRLVRRHGIGVLHARGHVPAAMGALAKSVSGGRLIFDIRGLLPEEYVDAGHWSESGIKYRLTKRMERLLFGSSDGFVVLTERARDTLFPGCADTDGRGRPIEIIPCCVDLDRFQAAGPTVRDEARRELVLTDRRVLMYIGALGGLYPVDELAQFLAVAHQQDPSTFSVILSHSPHDWIANSLQKWGVGAQHYLIRKVAPTEIPHYLQAADLAISFKKRSYSQVSCSPTKIAEYLACGIPVVSTVGIGDTDSIIETDRVGVVIREFSPEAYLRALHEAEELRQERGIADRCRATARARFHLEEVGGARYRRLYHRLFSREGRTYQIQQVRL